MTLKKDSEPPPVQLPEIIVASGWKFGDSMYATKEGAVRARLTQFISSKIPFDVKRHGVVSIYDSVDVIVTNPREVAEMLAFIL